MLKQVRESLLETLFTIVRASRVPIAIGTAASSRDLKD